jgi:hypothetical protein
VARYKSGALYVCVREREREREREERESARACVRVIQYHIFLLLCMFTLNFNPID